MKIQVSIEIPPEEVIQIMGGSSDVVIEIQKKIAEEVIGAVVKEQSAKAQEMFSPLWDFSRFSMMMSSLDKKA